MQGRHEYQPKLFSIVDIESLIPANHLLRKVDRVVDLSFVRELTKECYCSDKGNRTLLPKDVIDDQGGGQGGKPPGEIVPFLFSPRQLLTERGQLIIQSASLASGKS